VNNIITHLPKQDYNENVNKKSKKTFQELTSNINMPIMKHITPTTLLNDRKFSILDIQGAENLNNFRDLIGKNFFFF